MRKVYSSFDFLYFYSYYGIYDVSKCHGLGDSPVLRFYLLLSRRNLAIAHADPISSLKKPAWPTRSVSSIFEQVDVTVLKTA